MRRFVSLPRMVFIAFITAVILVIYGASLYKLQIYDKGTYDKNLPPDTTTTTVTIKAGRGNILDRNGELLVSSVASYNVILSRSELLASPDTNGNILMLVNAVEDHLQSYTDTFPVTKTAPFEYKNMSETMRGRMNDYFDFFNLPHDISASDLIIWMKNHYGIDYTTSLADTRRIIGVRWEMEIRVIVNMDQYIFVEDASQELISIIKESGCPGVYETPTYARRYNTMYAAQLLGYIGKMDAEQYAYYKDFDYPMDCYVGQEGVESAFETYLHGTDGKKLVTTTPDGTVVRERVIEPAQSGNNVYLSLDIKLQKVAEDSLSDTIGEINAQRSEAEQITGGSVVVTQVNTGETLVCASWPSYDPATIRSNYNELLEAPNSPLFNRATQGNYNPGSTFKMVTALAGLRSGTITQYTPIYDSGIYDKYDDFKIACWFHTQTGGGHGTLILANALERSCNYYFCWVGDNTGIEPIEQAAVDFGFGSPTGLEVYESSGVLPTAENKKKALGEDWYAADTLLASIGQGMNYYTTAQLCNYVATIANNGTRYKMTLLDKVTSFDYKTPVMQYQPVVAHEMTPQDKTFLPLLREGMELVAESGSAMSVFRNFPIKVGCKTGTTQSDTSATNSGVFVCYAPADDPEIAVSVVVEKGMSGSTVMTIAADIIRAYFNESDTTDTFLPVEGELVR